ncbi:MAG: sugar phosphate isomerase/epimerase family protein [Chloroflexota bacterium]
MKIGTDQYTIHHLTGLAGVGVLELARTHGLEGVQFLDIRRVSPTLDAGQLREAGQYARQYDLYMEIGIPCPNPHRAAPLGLQDGDGDLVLGLSRHLDIIARTCVGSRAVRCFIGGPGDRFKTAVPWEQQVRDTMAVVTRLRPQLRDLGLRLAFETHADITSFEAIRLVEELGLDVAGICLDTGNLFIGVEDPLLATRRAAPYTVTTHIKDGILFFGDDGLVYNPRACGEGALPLRQIVEVLYQANPDLNLSIEDHGRLFAVPIFNDALLGSFPDLSAMELAHLVRVARDCERKIATGEIADPATLEVIPWETQALDRLDTGAKHLREIMAAVSQAA